MQSMLILFYTSFLLLEYVYGTTIFNNANNKKLNNINQQVREHFIAILIAIMHTTQLP